MARSDVLIVGAGPTGLVLALWLTQLRVAVRIVDSATGPGTTSRALAVQARTLELYRQLDLSDVNVSEAHRLALAPDDVALAGSFGVPLVVARERPGLRIAALGFDPRRSDLPMRPAFPLLIANTLDWATHGGEIVAPEAIEPDTARDARESDTTPAPTLTLGGRTLAPPDPPLRHPRVRLEVMALLLAAALLLFEWGSYHRRWTT